MAWTPIPRSSWDRDARSGAGNAEQTRIGEPGRAVGEGGVMTADEIVAALMDKIADLAEQKEVERARASALRQRVFDLESENQRLREREYKSEGNANATK
jgi:hypothetical protein